LTDQPLDDLRHKRQIGHWSVVWRISFIQAAFLQTWTNYSAALIRCLSTADANPHQACRIQQFGYDDGSTVYFVAQSCAQLAHSTLNAVS